MIVSRLIPGQDLKRGIEDTVKNEALNSGIIICIIGSLNKAVLRMSNLDKRVFHGNFEIVSLKAKI